MLTPWVHSHIYRPEKSIKNKRRTKLTKKETTNEERKKNTHFVELCIHAAAKVALGICVLYRVLARRFFVKCCLTFSTRFSVFNFFFHSSFLMNTFFFMWMKTITLGNSYTYTLISSYPLITNNNNYISIPKAIHSQTVSECVLCAWLYTQHTYKHTATTVTCDGCNIVNNMYDIFFFTLELVFHSIPNQCEANIVVVIRITWMYVCVLSISSSRTNNYLAKQCTKKTRLKYILFDRCTADVLLYVCAYVLVGYVFLLLLSPMWLRDMMEILKNRFECACFANKIPKSFRQTNKIPFSFTFDK